MTAENIGGDSDGATEAIRALTWMMSPKAGEPAAGSESTEHTPLVATNPGLLNREAERELIGAGLTKGGHLQRTMLGCIACKLRPDSEGERGISISDFAQCSGSRPNSVRQTLQRLLESGVLDGVDHPGETTPSIYDHYVLGPVGKRPSFAGRLEKPMHCGLDSLQPATPQAAEETLLKERLITHRSPTRRVALACLGCRLHAGEKGIHATGVTECNEVDRATVYYAFRALVKKGVLQATREKTSHAPSGKGAPRVVYSPTDTPLGRRYREILEAEAPQTCGLQGTMEPEPKDS